MTGLGQQSYGPLMSHTAAISGAQRVSDGCLIALTYWLVERLRPQAWNVYNTLALLLAVVIFLLIGEANGLYRSWRGVALRHELQHMVTTWVLATPVLLFAAFLTETSEEFSRIGTVVWFIVTPTVLVAWRAATRLLLAELRRRGYNNRSVAIAGCTASAKSLIDHIERDPSAGMRLYGLYDDRTAARRTPMESDQGPFKGDLDQLVEDARSGKIDLVYISLPLRAETRIASILRKLGDTTATVYIIADFYGLNLLHSQWSAIGNLPVVSLHDTPFNGLGGWAKRLEDLVVGSLILLLTALPMLCVAVAIKVTSPGPVFFRQRRYGLNGREIRVLKFRTMTVCEDGDVVKQASRNDARVTRLGMFLRRTSLDELPQFLQVITGEMSIVGPRPHAVAHNEEYRRVIDGYMLRHKVKPGITGWAQVNGWRGETDAIEKMRMRVQHDLEYIRNWRLGLDIWIILMTIFGSKTRKNAY